MRCSICHGDVGRTHRATETMFGMGGEFFYWECAGCGCLSLQNVPADLNRYYPDNYYSLRQEMKDGIATKIADFLRATDVPLLSAFLNRHRPFWTIASMARLKTSDRILDVGSGCGGVVFRLRQIGFEAMGVDPNISCDIEDNGRLRVKKCQLADLPGLFTVVLLSHSLEHMPDQFAALCDVRNHLAPGGRAIVRIPLALADWREYGVNWHELDAPRHLFLHTPKSLSIVAERAGLRIRKVTFDSPNEVRNRDQQGERATFTMQVP
jgi:SAM-dependent methyltransferase